MVIGGFGVDSPVSLLTCQWASLLGSDIRITISGAMNGRYQPNCK